MHQVNYLPPQLLPFTKKTKEWRKKHLDWADNKTFFNDNIIRKSVLHKRTNINLINGILDMLDIELILNPNSLDTGYIPDKILHYPIMNSKLNVLRGEESKRRFDYRVIITNPNSISELENNKKNELFTQLQLLVADTSIDEEEYENKLLELSYYYTYEWLDLREIRANTLLNHYIKELDIPIKTNANFMNAMTVAEEIYLVDIVSGEPTVEVINPLKIRAFRSGYSNKFEDADIILLEDYWSPSRITDTFYQELTSEDVKKIEDLAWGKDNDLGDIDERKSFINKNVLNENAFINTMELFTGTEYGVNNYSDGGGNIKVLRMYWKSRRKVKKVKSYDYKTGEEVYNFYPETYLINKDLGEEEKVYWINEAWEGTKIGKDIYLNMRPRPIQYNRLSNPSRCHFGIIGSIYNFGDSKPYSLVDMMKPYNYLYNAVHDRLNKAIADNWGKIVLVDLAKIPKGWDFEKWMYYARVSKIAVTNSFNEGNLGASRGKLAGNFNATSGVIDAETGNYIQLHINLLEYIKMEMAEVAGISKQREGLISNRETVGGVERATLLSSHITEWLFSIHDDVKKRLLECLLETTKIALKGRVKKFLYITDDKLLKIMEIDGDEFAESDYGLIVDNSPATLDLASRLDGLAQAALLNSTLSFSTIMKIYTNTSLAETLRLIEKDELNIKLALKEEAEANRLALLEVILTQAQLLEADREFEREKNIRDNETKVLIELMRLAAKEDTSEDVEYSPKNKEKLLEDIRQFDAKMSLEREKLNQKKKEHNDEMKIKRSKA